MTSTITTSTRPRGVLLAAAIGALITGLLAGSPLPSASADEPQTRTIEGTVSLPQGAPSSWLKGVQVLAMPVPAASAGKVVRPDPDTGVYVITGLASSNYRIQFTSAAYLDGDHYTTPNLLSEFYDDARLIEDSTLVDVTAADADGIDAELAPGRTLSGRVTLGDGADQSWLRAVKVVVQGRPALPVDPVTGEYAFSRLAPDVYPVRFTVESYWDGALGRSVRPNLIEENYDDATGEEQATFVDLRAGDVGSIDALLETGRTITGRVSLPPDADGAWMTNVRVSATASTSHQSTAGVIDARTGDYTVTGLRPGGYTLCFDIDPIWNGEESNRPQLVPECYDNAVSTPPTVVDLSAGDRSAVNATLAYIAGYSPPITVQVYRFWSDRFQSHFYTADPAERDAVIRNWPKDWTYEGPRYTALKTPSPGTIPLYRFWSGRYQSHFYTASQEERDGVMARWPDDWTYEGIAYYVYPEYPARPGTLEVTRFWSPVTGHHFYTTSAAEREMISLRWPNFWREEFDRFRVPANGSDAG